MVHTMCSPLVLFNQIANEVALCMAAMSLLAFARCNLQTSILAGGSDGSRLGRLGMMWLVFVMFLVCFLRKQPYLMLMGNHPACFIRSSKFNVCLRSCSLRKPPCHDTIGEKKTFSQSYMYHLKPGSYSHFGASLQACSITHNTSL